MKFMTMQRICIILFFNYDIF